MLGVLGIADDPRSRWAEVERIVGGLQLAEQAIERRGRGPAEGEREGPD